MPQQVSSLRRLAKRSPALRHAWHRAQLVYNTARTGYTTSFEDLPADVAVDIAYQVLLERPPDPAGRQFSVGFVLSGYTNREMVAYLRSSSEFAHKVRFPPRLILQSLHASRCQFVRSLPRAGVIVDLGGTDLNNPNGAMVAMGYPYRFDGLTIVDLPPEDRHDLYQQQTRHEARQSPMGPVHYLFHSMTDLSEFADGSVDLVYSGQSIEHVTPEDGLTVLQESARILRPGGHIAIDTPNGRVTRLQKDEFIDPDHKIEYTLDQLTAAIEKAGLEVVEVKGANYAGDSLAAGVFDDTEVAGNSGLYWEAEDCYLLCVVARKP